MSETSNISRRVLLQGAGAGAAIVAGGALLPGAAVAAPLAPPTAIGPTSRPFGRHLAFGADPSRQVVVSWQSHSKVTGPYVRVGTSPGNLGAPIAAELRQLDSKLSWQKPAHEFPPNAPSTLSQYFLHAKLNDLAPGTQYHYVVGHQGYDPTASGRVGEVATFRTAGSAGAFSFTAFGDQGTGYNALTTTSVVADLAPAFHLSLGDHSYAIRAGEGGNTKDTYDARIWDSWFAQNDPVASGTPWMITLGNREVEKWYAANGYAGTRARFAMPDNAWDGSTGIYSWRYHNVGLISLDANEVCYRYPANLDYTGGKQLSWLDAQLGRFRADKTIDFVVVYCHQSLYSTGETYGSELYAQQKWAPLFDKHQVDLVLNGHNRCYERTDPIRAGKASKEAKPRGTVNSVKDGTTYVTAGGGGQFLDTFYKKAPESYLDNEKSSTATTMKTYAKGSSSAKETKVTWSRVRYRGYSLVQVEVTPAVGATPARLKVRGIAEDSTLIDEVTVQRS